MLAECAMRSMQPVLQKEGIDIYATAKALYEGHVVSACGKAHSVTIKRTDLLLQHEDVALLHLLLQLYARLAAVGFASCIRCCCRLHCLSHTQYQRTEVAFQSSNV